MSNNVNKIYKIRDPKTGLYSTGGLYFRWSKTGKTWSSLRNLKGHLALNPNYGFNIVVDEFNSNPEQSFPVSELVK